MLVYVDGELYLNGDLQGVTRGGSDSFVFGGGWSGSIDEAMIWHRVLTPEEINATYQAGIYNLYHNFTNLIDGVYNYTAYSVDQAGNLNQTQRSVTYDTGIPPDINITYPINNTEYSINTVDVNYTVSDVALGYCWYSNDTYTVNTSLSAAQGSCSNITTVVWSQGQHNVTVWVNDTANNLNWSIVTFNVSADLTAQDINFTMPPTPPNATVTTNTSVEINVSITEANLDEVKFNWNASNETIFKINSQVVEVNFTNLTTLTSLEFNNGSVTSALFNDSLLLMYNFDNLSSLGENDTYVVDVGGGGGGGGGMG
jgi:hypothetical protein